MPKGPAGWGRTAPQSGHRFCVPPGHIGPREQQAKTTTITTAFITGIQKSATQFHSELHSNEQFCKSTPTAYGSFDNRHWRQGALVGKRGCSKECPQVCGASRPRPAHILCHAHGGAQSTLCRYHLTPDRHRPGPIGSRRPNAPPQSLREPRVGDPLSATQERAPIVEKPSRDKSQGIVRTDGGCLGLYQGKGNGEPRAAPPRAASPDCSGWRDPHRGRQGSPARSRPECSRAPSKSHDLICLPSPIRRTMPAGRPGPGSTNSGLARRETAKAG